MNGKSCQERLLLPQVTLCAVTSVNVEATLRALEVCLAHITFADCKLLTDAPVRPSNPAIRVVPINRLTSSAAYSEFVLTRLVDHVETSHCLVVQWDGHVLDARRWDPQFLDYDYIGARWPQFSDGHDVGNGGFSLRSRRLMQACRAPAFQRIHPEDMAIGRTNRDWLEAQEMRFAPPALADLFAAERSGDLTSAFGYHGAWNMPEAVGDQAFWPIYRGLDERGTVWTDFGAILRAVVRGRGGAKRALRLTADRLRHGLRHILKA
jgi:hypothetical protein